MLKDIRVSTVDPPRAFLTDFVSCSCTDCIAWF